ncbi:MAG TPA: TAXI family TRAP transporter solute-binding subunit [Dissulfurispiraceae bacterium]|nr:TAXI family TRAP transporter solute-binding subunit [Dissulfurispiraceae bacterium]
MMIYCLLVIGLFLLLATFWFFHSAPPGTIIMASGPPGSIFYSNAEKYAKILLRHGVTLKVLPSAGSADNLKQLSDASHHVDIGFIQSGTSDGKRYDNLISLGSVSYQPVLIFYRNKTSIDLLSDLKGKSIAVGPEGSGTHKLALTLLAANGIEQGSSTTLLTIDSDIAVKYLVDNKIDAVFLMGDSASLQNIRTLLLAPGIYLFDMTQADGYTRRISYLSKLILPKGAVDFGNNIPDHDVHLVTPTVELVARDDLHPALLDLFIEAAQEVHGGAGLFRNKAEFPSPVSFDFIISDDAIRYYKSGKTFLYRYLPFRLANLANRFLVVFVPIILLLIPGIRVIPAVYRLRVNLNIYKWYRVLLALEREVMIPIDPSKQSELLQSIDRIERDVDAMKVTAPFAEEFYVLRGNINFVRTKILNSIRLSA